MAWKEVNRSFISNQIMCVNPGKSMRNDESSFSFCCCCWSWKKKVSSHGIGKEREEKGRAKNTKPWKTQNLFDKAPENLENVLKNTVWKLLPGFEFFLFLQKNPCCIAKIRPEFHTKQLETIGVVVCVKMLLLLLLFVFPLLQQHANNNGMAVCQLIIHCQKGKCSQLCSIPEPHVHV